MAGNGIYALSGPDHWRAFVAGAYGINEGGTVAGNSGTESTPDGTAWVWTPTTGRANLIDLIDVPGVYGIRSGRDINDHGQIVARATTDQPYGSVVVLTPIP